MNNIDYQNVPHGDIVINVFSNENLSAIHASNHGNRVELVYAEGNTQLKQHDLFGNTNRSRTKDNSTDFEWSIIGGGVACF